MESTLKFSLPDHNKFFTTLRDRVNGYFRDKKISRNGDYRMYLKTMAMLAFYLFPFTLMFLFTFPVIVCLIFYIIMGIGLVGIGMSVMHDANHGSYSSKGWINDALSYSMNLIGGHSLTWKIQHNVMHHTYTNIYGLDEDVEDKPILRLSPNGKWYQIHKYQHLYAPFLYALSTLSWILWKDFKALAHYNREGKTQNLGHHPGREFWVLLITKILYWLVFFVCPLLFFSLPVWVPILGFFLMHVTAGLIMTMVFQLAHVVENTDHFQPNEEGNIENVWAIHQMRTTSNFAPQNILITWFVGGLNFQVEHHLFPNICHVHYPEISKIVKSTAKEFGLPYLEYSSFGEALFSHFKTLKALGQNNLEAKIL